jgi:D-proline reductase (dithiol) PrdB
VSLTARYLEENGIPTVIMGTARDIVEYCGVPRFLFVDFPLGNPCGEPGNVEQQRHLFQAALELLENANGPRTTVQAPDVWPGGDDWKRLIFSDEQPFLEGEIRENWLKGKQAYKEARKDTDS